MFFQESNRFDAKAVSKAGENKVVSSLCTFCSANFLLQPCEKVITFTFNNAQSLNRLSKLVLQVYPVDCEIIVYRLPCDSNQGVRQIF